MICAQKRLTTSPARGYVTSAPMPPKSVAKSPS